MPTSRSYVLGLSFRWENMPWLAGDELVRKVGQIPPSKTPSGVAIVALNPDLSRPAIVGRSPAAAHSRTRALLAASMPMSTSRDCDMLEYSEDNYIGIAEVNSAGLLWSSIRSPFLCGKVYA
jgi:hypothetical protein